LGQLQDCASPLELFHRIGGVPICTRDFRSCSATMMAGQKPFSRFTHEKRRNRNFKFATLIPPLNSNFLMEGGQARGLPTHAMFLPTQALGIGNSSAPAVRMRIRKMRRPATPVMPAAGDPATAVAANRPIARRPDVAGCRIGGRHHRGWRGHDDWRSHHHRCGRSDRHNGHGQRQSERKAEPDSGIGRQSRRAEQRGRE